MSEKVVNAALLGLGTVGTGVYKVIKNQEQEMTAKLGCQVKITKILVRNLEKASKKVEDPSVLTTDWADIEGDPSIDIVIELIGGIEPARTYILAALKAGKNVVTANKDLIAVHGKEILETAKAAQKDFLFEAAVAGGIPIISPLKNSLEANHVTEVMGIVNGTTNFILTKMSQEGMEFSDALALATELGYAEADPTADIEGIDAGRKVAILASVAFNSRVTLDNVHIEGITKITAKDIRYAKEMGCEIKLLGVARCQENGVEAYVCPMLIPAEHPLASVNDSYNAVFVNGDAVFYQNGSWEYSELSKTFKDDELAMIPIYFGVDDANEGLATGTENYWCVNKNASKEDIQATLDFMNWCVTSDDGVKAMCKDMGFTIPFKKNLKSDNVLVNEANKYTEDGKTPVSWNFSTMPSEEWKNGVGSALTSYAADPTDANWAKVTTAFVDGWAKEAAAAK